MQRPASTIGSSRRIDARATAISPRSTRAGGRTGEPQLAVAAERWDREAWIVFAIVMVLVLLRSISRFTYSENPDNSIVGQLVWGSIYLYAGIRLVSLRAISLPIAKRSTSLVVFLGIVIASSIWSVDSFSTFKYAVELVGTTLVAFYIVVCLRLERFLTVLSAAFAMLGIASLLLVYGSPARGRMDFGAGVFCGVFADKNALGAAMAILIVSLCLRLPLARGSARYALAAMLAIGGWLLLGSNSITAAFACVAAALGVGIALGIRDRRYGTILVAVFAAGLGAFVLFEVLGNDSSLFFNSVGRDSNLTGRTELWPPLLQAVADRPFFGYGYSSFFTSDVRLDYLGDFIATINWNPPHAHNSFLQIAIDVGLVGLGAFLVVLVTALRRAIGIIASTRSWVALWPLAIVIYLVAGSYDETYFAQANTVEWVVFVAALLYPLRSDVERIARIDR